MIISSSVSVEEEDIYGFKTLIKDTKIPIEVMIGVIRCVLNKISRTAEHYFFNSVYSLVSF